MTEGVATTDPAVRRLREALFAFFAQSSRASAIGLVCPPLRDAYDADDTSEVFEASDVAPAVLRYRLHVGESGPYGAADLLIGLPDLDARVAALEAISTAAPSWAHVSGYGDYGVTVSLPVPLMTARGGFDPHAAELALRWFRMLADWWDRDGRAMVPAATTPTRG